ncbi:copper homeostasis protein CutC [Anaerosinus massiliensis]|uniref:copper homeostasis protein CutC n=1 Tax=Massilibacillus massiliensis TaxID=1806837 RepID=UPI000A476065|nr:copper homeostasis protein CutC [Massilibacillus massiliensis]
MVEIIAMTVEDAKQIEAGGADRIELVSALSEGGLTPSYGLIEAVVNAVKIPVNIMVRPHAKGFCYTTDEINLMKRDIEFAKQLKVNGVVFGVLDEQKNICEANLQKLLSVCDGLEVTFSRAIDLINPVNGMKILAKYPQVTTVISSGGTGFIKDNIEILNKMVAHAKHIRLLIGGGLTLDNVEEIMQAVKHADFHFGSAARENSSLFGDISKARIEKLVHIIRENK